MLKEGGITDDLWICNKRFSPRKDNPPSRKDKRSCSLDIGKRNTNLSSFTNARPYHFTWFSFSIIIFYFFHLTNKGSHRHNNGRSYVKPYRHGTTTSSLLEIFRSYNSLHNDRYRQGVAAIENIRLSEKDPGWSAHKTFLHLYRMQEFYYFQHLRGKHVKYSMESSAMKCIRPLLWSSTAWRECWYR